MKLVLSKLLPPLLLLVLSAKISVLATSCNDTRTLMAIDTFVDSYYAYAEVVLATSDGGAVYAARRNDNGVMRLVKVDSDAKLEWFSEQRVQGDSFGWYFPNALVEDSSGSDGTGNSYVYLGGYATSNGFAGVVIKYNMLDGSYVNSAFIQIGTNQTYLYAMLVDDDNNRLVVGGYDGTNYVSLAFVGTVDKETLEFTVQSLTNLTHAPEGAQLMAIVPDSGVYVLAGIVPNNQLWVAAVDSSTWVGQWEYATNDSSAYAYSVDNMITLSSGVYLVLAGNYVYNVSVASGIRPVNQVVVSSYGLATTYSSNEVALIGSNQGTDYAYYYDMTKNCTSSYSSAASYPRITMIDISTHPSFDYIWVSGYVWSRPYLGALLKFKLVTPIICESGKTNYLNRGCYTPINSSDCFGLCKTCLVTGSIDACATVNTTIASTYAVSLFAGRCLTNGYHYSSAARSCVPIVRDSCHPLCGGECLVPNNATKCAFHCVGTKFEPNIDSSDLGHNVCKCKAGTAYNSTSQKCESCHVLCGSAGCAVPADASSCINCAVSAVASVAAGSSYVLCSCRSNTIFSGTGCDSCSDLCLGCTVAADPTKCLACSADIVGVKRIGVSAPYECACPSGTTYYSSSASCVYSSGCHPLCNGLCVSQNDSTACFGSCNPTASSSLSNSGLTSSSAASQDNVYTCTCASTTVYNGSACLPIFTVGCHPLCGSSGCIAKNDPAACVDCVSQPNVVSTLLTLAVSCTCAPNTSLTPAGICAFSTGCHAYCSVGCTVQANSEACLSCAAGFTAVSTKSSSSAVQCICSSNSILSGSTCESCGEMCSGCSVANDNTKCAVCVQGTNVVTKGSAAPYECACQAGAEYRAGIKACVYTSGCHALCNGACLERSNSASCVGGCSQTATGTLTNATTTLYSCACPALTVYNGTSCATVVYSGCHALCNQNSGCLEAGNSAACVSCSTQQNVLATATASGRVYNCSCAANTTLAAAGVCVYTAECSKYCGSAGCLSKSNSSACLDCATGITPTPTSTASFACTCPGSTAYYNSSCVITLVDSLSTSTCHPLCGGVCIAANDRTKCVGSCNLNVSDVISVNESGDVISCGCADGTHLNEEYECISDQACGAMCYNCSSGGECLACNAEAGVELSEGKCVCASSDGYIEVSDGDSAGCAKRSEKVTAALLYSGFVSGSRFG